ncbi:tRNA (adenosine(37)-N6)-threonylcarbamoyltransferase complex dimerization subunit type 1 TsaB [Candidatus Gottesmanbacteria bacterium]|nr:tRNA (adenosine(37)-N6)-threonylcarbamoyltransferase complex dimerization subunit type 1 TsaB [Candidatus Gottesmanbacteria bacterium]
MNKLYLYINTSDSTITTVGLEKNRKKYLLKEKTGDLKSQNLLPLIDKILKKHKQSFSSNKVKLEDLTGIEVNTGPGSFTGLRVGVAVANTLGWILGIPVNGKKGLVLPQY